MVEALCLKGILSIEFERVALRATAVTCSAKRSQILAQNRCSGQEVCLLSTRAPMGPRACLAPPALRSLPCSPEDQKPEWSSYSRSMRTDGLSVNLWRGLRSRLAVPTQGLPI